MASLSRYYPTSTLPAMYEMVRLDTMILLGDKLTSDGVLDLLKREAGPSGPAPEAA